MTLSLILLSLSILLLIVSSAFFSGSETALTAASRATMHGLRNRSRNADIVFYLLSIRQKLIGALLLSNNLVNILASALATSLFIGFFGDIGVLFATIAMTIIVVIFAEVLPKSWAISDPDRFALAVARPVRFVVFLFGPPTSMIGWIVRSILHLFRIDLDSRVSVLAPHEELRSTLNVLETDDATMKTDRARLGGILDLHDLEVSDIMVHRTSMMSLNADESPSVLVDQIISSPYTRIPVWEGETDNIIGILHAKNFIRQLSNVSYDISSFGIRDTMTDPWFVPESTPLRDQLNAFMRGHAHIALVVDEYGEVQGLVTLEDILEEIVGEIADEHDEDVSGLSHQVDGSYLVDGSLTIRDLNRALDWNLPDEEATTVAGLVIHEAQTIPNEKQTFTFHNKRFVVLRREKNRITQLRIRDLG